MPVTTNLSGLRVGNSLTLSASQNAITTGNFRVDFWSAGGDAGTPVIYTKDRSFLQIAPDSIRFAVDLSACTFDTPAPVGDEVYNKQYHDLIYLWDMGDPGLWTEPVNVLPAWKNRNVAKGPEVRHIYREPGTYTVSVLIIEPSSGKTASATLDVDVADPDVFYGHENTMYVNNVGDDDWSYVPAGVPEANKVQTDELYKYLDTSVSPAVWPAHPIWKSREAQNVSHPTRWRFKRGGSWEFSVYINGNDVPGITFEDYGDPAQPKPVFNIYENPETWQLYVVRMGYNHADYGDYDPYTKPPEFRIRNIRGQGHFNSVTSPATSLDSERSVFAWFISACNFIMHDCNMDGFGNSNFNFQHSTGSDYSVIGMVHMDNCSITNFGGQYPIITSNAATDAASVCLTGFRFEQPGDAMSSGSGEMGSRSPGRFNSTRFIHIRGLDSFITEGDLTHFQIVKSGQLDGSLVNIHSCSAEGGAAFFDTDGSYQQTPQMRSHVHNIIVDSVVYVGGWNAKCMFAPRSTGVTARNCLYIVPNTPRFYNGTQGMFRITEENDTGQPLPDFVADAPIQFYNCTYLILRTYVQNAPSLNKPNPPMAWSDEAGAEFPNLTVREENNIYHQPNYVIPENPITPYVPFAPLSETILWTPRGLGRRDPDTGILDTTYAVPADTVRESRPLPGSAAAGASITGNMSWYDITGAVRSRPPTMGAFEAA